MVEHNFKKISVVPNGNELVGTILSQTQITPPVINNNYKINRLRQMYIRKVKYTQKNLHNKLSTIIEDFPHTYQMHPFYSDLLLLNVALYDKDHYKAALRQVDTSRNLIRKIAKEYVKLLKDGESLYRCNCLKVVAFGLMCIILNRLAPSLVYLEQIRQLMASLPSVDTDTKTGTVLICGYPNVGKTCFMNKVITKADSVVDVFTEKSIFVGYTDYKNVPYQVIDTPGILDRQYRDHNMIEKCSIIALAHLRAVILFFVDISGSCGYTISQQAGLFHSIKSMFKNKPLLIVCNKTDLMPMENISEEDMKLIKEMKAEAMKPMTTTIGASEEEAVILKMSTLADEDVMYVKDVVCGRLSKKECRG